MKNQNLGTYQNMWKNRLISDDLEKEVTITELQSLDAIVGGLLSEAIAKSVNSATETDSVDEMQFKVT